MRRHCFALDLKNEPGLIAAYRKWHEAGAPPAAVTRSIRAAGIAALEIHLCGNRLFMIMEVHASFSFEKQKEMDAGNATVQDWEKLMWKFQQALPFAEAGEKWKVMEKIFETGE